MSKLIEDFFVLFLYETGVLGEFRPYLEWGGNCLLVLAVLGCLFGFRTYRGFFSVLLFMGIAICCCFFLEGKMSWGSVVTSFTVAGVVLGFLGYRWQRLGGFVICGLIGYMFGWLLLPNVLTGLLGAALCGAALLYFPVISLSVLSSLWGAWLLKDCLEIKGVSGGLLVVGVTVVCSAWQLFFNRKQKLFTKPCPQGVKLWLEKRREKNGG